MTVLLVLVGLGLLLAAWCWWEARSGRPAWGAHLEHDPASAARLGKGAAASAAASAAIALDGGADG